MLQFSSSLSKDLCSPQLLSSLALLSEDLHQLPHRNKQELCIAVPCDCARSHQTDREGWMTEGRDLTLVFVGPIVTFDNLLQVGMVALNQCSEGIFGDIHALGDGLSQVALLRKT